MVKVTGPYADPRDKGKAWTVVTMRGDFVEHHKFASPAEAQAFADKVNGKVAV